MTPVFTRGRRSYELISDESILLALARAQLHEENPWKEKGVEWPRLLEHLDFAHEAHVTRMLRPQVEKLIESGHVFRIQYTRDRIRFGLTPGGRRRATSARRKGTSLPESPQHRDWRMTRENAAQLLADVRKQLGDNLAVADGLLKGSDDAAASEWYAVAKRLGAAAGGIGAAMFFLKEWPEPDDEHPDLDRQSPLNAALHKAHVAWGQL